MLLMSFFVLLFLFFMTGTFASRLMHHETSFSDTMVSGFLVLMSVFHIMAFGFTQVHSSFTAFFWAFLVLLLAMVTAGTVAFFQNKHYAVYYRHFRNIAKMLWNNKLIAILMILAIGGCLVTSLCFIYVSSDVSLYFPRAMEILKRDQMYIPQGLAWFGIEEHSYLEPLDYTTLEAFRAFCSKLFGLHVAAFSRTPFSAAMLVVSFCAVYGAYRSLTEKESGNRLILFLILYYILVLRCSAHGDSAPFWMIKYPSEGKSILLTVIHPALITYCANIIHCAKGKISWDKWLSLSLAFLAGVCVTVNGIYWPFLCCVSMGLPYLLIERRRDFLKLLPAVLAACIPVILYGSMAIVEIFSQPAFYEEMVMPTWVQAYKRASDPWLLYLFIPALIYLAFKGSRTVKFLILGSTAFLFGILLNPLLLVPVSRYISSPMVYFRLFWMVHFYFVIAYAGADLLCRVPKRILNLVILLIPVLLAAFYAGHKICRPGVPITEDSRIFTFIKDEAGHLIPHAPRKQNAYCLYPEHVDCYEKMLQSKDEKENVRVFWMCENASMIRQYSARFELIGGVRKNQKRFFDQPLEPGTRAPYDVYLDFIKEDALDFTDPVKAHEELKAMKIDYIFVDTFSGFDTREETPEGFTSMGDWLIGGIRGYSVD